MRILTALLALVFAFGLRAEDEPEPEAKPEPKAEPAQEMTPEDGFLRAQDIIKRWMKEDFKLFQLLFMGEHRGALNTRELTDDQYKRLEAWRKEAPSLFASMYGNAWPEAVQINGKYLRL